MTNKLLLLNDVARLLRRRPHQITYAITSQAVEDVTLRIGNRRMFQANDVRRLAEHFGVPLPQERKQMDEYATMKEIGTVFGVSSHTVGRKLLELGYRTEKKKPSGKAFQEGMVQQKHTFDYANYLWAWHREKTVAVLEQAGFVKETPSAAS